VLDATQRFMELAPDEVFVFCSTDALKRSPERAGVAAPMSGKKEAMGSK
jgi:hypothetical protein